jgi:hypothetical protein
LFDTELPPEARSELVRPKLTQNRRESVDDRQRARLIIGGLLGAIGLVCLGAFLGQLKQRSNPITVPAAVVPTPAAQALPAQAPVPEPALSHSEPAVPRGEAPAPVVASMPTPVPVQRAELVKLPPPRAKLVGIPLGSWVRLTMPDGSKMFAFFRGTVPSGRYAPRCWGA